MQTEKKIRKNEQLKYVERETEVRELNRNKIKKREIKDNVIQIEEVIDRQKERCLYHFYQRFIRMFK